MAAATTLRQKQAPIKDQYRSDPASALITLRSTGTLDSSSITCSLGSGSQIKDAKQRVAGLHQMAGGDDPEISGELCSGDMLLDALVACAGVTLKAVATALKIPVKSGLITASGDLDFRGTLGVDKNAPVGITAIELAFELELEDDAEIEDDKIERLGSLTEKYCVVLQTITNKPAVKVSVQGSQSTKDGIDRQYNWVQRC